MKDEMVMKSILFPIMRLPLFFLMIFVVSCSSTNSPGTAPGMILFVPGASGDGSWYKNIVPAIRDSSDQRTIKCIDWGAPKFAFVFNFNTPSIHEAAERKLADEIVCYRKAYPRDPLDIIAHSAGGGVALGALTRLPTGIRVDKVILLHPSVSPTYPLTAPLKACDCVELFCSDQDKTFLSWRTSTFGTYDNVNTKAAGNQGFDLSALSAAVRSKIRTHAYTESDRALENDGDHFGALSLPFLRERVVPLLLR